MININQLIDDTVYNLTNLLPYFLSLLYFNYVFIGPFFLIFSKNVTDKLYFYCKKYSQFTYQLSQLVFLLNMFCPSNGFNENNFIQDPSKLILYVYYTDMSNIWLIYLNGRTITKNKINRTITNGILLYTHFAGYNVLSKILSLATMYDQESSKDLDPTVLVYLLLN